VVKTLLAVMLALIVFLIGGLASIQWLTLRDTYPWAVIIAAFWLGGLMMAWAVMEIGRRMLSMLSAIGEEPPPPPKVEDDDEEDDRPPPRRQNRLRQH